MRSFALIALLATQTAAAAQTPLSPEAFEAMTEGRTVTFLLDGAFYGAEEYREGREVIWQFRGEECQRGYWYPDGDAICFVYEGLVGPDCWLFFDEGGLFATHLDGGLDIYEGSVSEEPLECRGPAVGV